jgi:hypothetical protein
MNRLNERGAMNILLLPLIIVLVFLVGALGFGFWAFAGRSDYKNNSDQKVSAAVQEAIGTQKALDAKQAAQDAKKPYDTFIGSAAYGNVTINYPRTWSGYVVQNDRNTSKPISGYFQPSIVPDVNSSQSTYALRVELVQQSYDNVISSFASSLKEGKVTLEPYKLTKVPSVVGSRIEGQINSTKQGVMIALPLRNMTLKVWTESNDFKADLDTAILPNMSFVP